MLFITAKCKAAEVLCQLKASKANCQNKIMGILARSGELVMRSTVAFKKSSGFQLSLFLCLCACKFASATLGLQMCVLSNTPPNFALFSRIWTQIPTLVRQVFYPLSHLSSLSQCISVLVLPKQSDFVVWLVLDLSIKNAQNIVTHLLVAMTTRPQLRIKLLKNLTAVILGCSWEPYTAVS